MKSALEIAMERAEKLDNGEGIILSDRQKELISSIRQEYKGKIAEREIMLKDLLKKVAGSYSEDGYQAAQIRKEEFLKEKNRLKEEMELKIKNIRRGS